MNNPNEPNTYSSVDADLAGLSAALDRLALDDSPSRPGLEGRIYAATLPSLRVAAGHQAITPALKLVRSRSQPKRSLAQSTPMRAAAALALLATAMAAWMANRAPVVQQPRAQHDDWAVMSSMFDDKNFTEIDELLTATAGLDERVKGVSDSDLLEEGSM